MISLSVFGLALLPVAVRPECLPLLLTPPWQRPLWKRARRAAVISLWRASGLPLWVLLHAAAVFDPALQAKGPVIGGAMLNLPFRRDPLRTTHHARFA
jgi:hypothetical protein